MKIQFTKKDDKKAKFSMTGVSYTAANTVRRAIMTYVPSMAVTKATLYENTSPLYEEMIAQRIGLVPFVTDLETYSLPAECKCGGKGCGRCEVSLILEKSGPCVVYSGDIKSQDPKVKPVFDKIPITKLGNSQKIKMEMVASLGLMGQHAKFQCALCSYKQTAEDEFDFFVESYNNLTPQDIIETAMENLEVRIKELSDAFEDKKSSSRKSSKKAVAKKKSRKK